MMNKNNVLRRLHRLSGLVSVLLFSAGGVIAEPTVLTHIKGYSLPAVAPDPSRGADHPPGKNPTAGLMKKATSDEPAGDKWQSFNTLVFDQGKILAVGDAQLIKQYPQATLIDGKGQVVLPGLIDAHGHVISLGFNRLNLDVRGLTSATATALAVQAYAKAHPQMNWIKGRGWNQELWPGRQFPTLNDLDEYVADKPVWLRRVDGHAGWANRKALALAGIDKNTIDPAGGLIMRDNAGLPTGILVDNAMKLLESVIPLPNQTELQSALDTASEHLLSVGLTSVHDAGINQQQYQLYRHNAAKQQLKIRLYAMLAALDPQLLAMLQQGIVNEQQDRLSIRSVKLSVDGALGSRGAALLAPYADKPEQSGLMLVDQEQMDLVYEQTVKHGFQLNVHAIGDKGNRLVLDQFEKAYGLWGGKTLRHRIEHAQVVALADIPRFKTLDIIPSMQPTHATSDMNMAESRIGAERLKGAYAWQLFLQQGSRIAAGSDFPIELANPFHGIHAAVTRQNQQNQPLTGWLPSQAMTLEQALKAFTLDAAYAAHQDQLIGSLVPGKWADFIVIDQDIFTINPPLIWQTKVLQTWVGGELNYQAQ